MENSENTDRMARPIEVTHQALHEAQELSHTVQMLVIKLAGPWNMPNQDDVGSDGPTSVLRTLENHARRALQDMSDTFDALSRLDELLPQFDAVELMPAEGSVRVTNRRVR